MPCPQGQDVGVVGRAFGAAIPAVVVVGAVFVILAVGFVVFVVVADEIFEREAVMAGDEIDAGVGSAAALLIKIAAAAKARGEFGHGAGVRLPKAAHAIAIFAVPLGPEDGEVADLVAPLADIPRLGDQLYLREHGILVNDVEEGAQLVDGIKLAGQSARQVEAETIDVHFDDPIAQAIHDELQDARMHHVQRVAAAGEIHVEALVLRRETIIGGVVDAAHRQRRPQLVAFRGVVVDNVKDDFDAGRVQGAHHHLELVNGAAAARCARRIPPPGPKRRACCNPNNC